MVIVKEDKTISCPRCQSQDIVRHGFKGTIKGGRQQRYYCNKCCHTFYFNGGKASG